MSKHILVYMYLLYLTYVLLYYYMLLPKNYYYSKAICMCMCNRLAKVSK